MSVLDPETVDQLRALAREANSDLLNRLQASFARDTPPRLVALRAAISSGDADAVAFGLHTLSGSAANLGAIEIVATCRQIESARETRRPAGDRTAARPARAQRRRGQARARPRGRGRLSGQAARRMREPSAASRIDVMMAVTLLPLTM